MGLFSTLKSMVSPPSMLQETAVAHMRTYLAFKKESPRDPPHVLLALTLRSRLLTRHNVTGDALPDDLEQHCLRQTFALSVFPVPLAIRALAYRAFEVEHGAKFYSLVPGAQQETEALAWAMKEVTRRSDFLTGYHDENPGIEATQMPSGKWYFKMVPVDDQPSAANSQMPWWLVPDARHPQTMDEWRKLRYTCEACRGPIRLVESPYTIPLMECKTCGSSFLLASP